MRVKMRASSMPEQTFGPNGAVVSRIGLGCMRLAGTWNPAEVGPANRRRAIEAFTTALELGITFYDHADFYGGTACEAIFKDCLAAAPGARERIFVATKVGIRYPHGYYDHSPAHIRRSIEESLSRMGLDYVDLYQLHRPDPLAHPGETAAVLDELVETGLVRAVGVSNYYPHQVLALRRYLHAPIVSNQISLSLLRLDPLYEGAAGGGGDGVLDQCLAFGMTPLAYSPVGAGRLSGHRPLPPDEPGRRPVERILAAMAEMSTRYGGATPIQLSIAWLLRHPAAIIPLVGSNDPAHIREMVGAAHIELSREDWYKLWVAARGAPVP
jgi:predicted oxidoreductase